MLVDVRGAAYTLFTMRRKRRSQIVAVVVIAAILLAIGKTYPVRAELADVPSLVISQFKLTSSNGQFITLYNATDHTLDMSKYQLVYFNSYDLSKATSSRLLVLTGTVAPHSYFMINDSALLLCYQLTIDSQSLGFSTTAGLVQILALDQTKSGGSVTPILEDYIAWSKTAVPGVQTLPTNTSAFLQRQPVNEDNNPDIGTAGDGSWQSVQPDSSKPCDLITTSTMPTAIATGLSELLPPTEAPATLVVLSTSGDVITAPVLPASDIGLMAPQITEILPNPLGTGTDDMDEFIELYNPNPVAFDLTGFSLQAGLTTLRSYNFPAGTMLPPTSFTAFYSADTHLSLSNSGSQIKLLDPFGNSISASKPYGTAKDGQAWALAKGAWYWTLKVTPKAANIVELPPAKKSANKATSKKATQTNPLTNKSDKKSVSPSLAGNIAEIVSSSPVHPAVLALIPGLALLYGAYEYRTDLANRTYQFRSYLRSRRGNREPLERR